MVGLPKGKRQTEFQQFFTKISELWLFEKKCSIGTTLPLLMIMKFHCTIDEKLFGGTEFQNRFKKHRKHLFNLDSLEKTVFEPNIFVSLSSGFNARVN